MQSIKGDAKGGGGKKIKAIPEQVAKTFETLWFLFDNFQYTIKNFEQ